VTELVFSFLSVENSALGTILMSIRFLVNCFNSLALRPLVTTTKVWPLRVFPHIDCHYHPPHQAFSLVAPYIKHQNKQVRLAVATFFVK